MQRVQSRDQLAAGEVARGAKDDDSVRHKGVSQNRIEVNPPSQYKSSPVIYEPARRDSSSSAAPTSSWGSPKRCMGVPRMIFSTRSASRILRFCSAGKKPGHNTFTRTFFVAYSRARFLVRLTTAAFAAE